MICKKQFYIRLLNLQFVLSVQSADSRLSFYQEFRIYLWAVGTKWGPES